VTRSEALKLYRRLLPYAQPHVHRLVLLLLVSFLMVGLGLVQPWPMKVLVDNVIGGRPFPGEIYLPWDIPAMRKDFPSDFPLYPNLTYVGPQQLAGEVNGSRFDRLWFKTMDDGPTVLRWYEEKLLVSPYPPEVIIDTGWSKRYRLDPTTRLVEMEIFWATNQPTVVGIDYIPTLEAPDIGVPMMRRIWLLAGVALATLLLFLLRGLLSLASTYLNLHAGQRMVLGLRSNLFNHLQRLSLPFHDSRPVGDSIYRVTADTYCIQTLLLSNLLPLLTSSLTVVGMFAILWRLDWELAVLALMATPPLYGSVRYYAARLAPRAEEMKYLESGVVSLVQRVLSAIRLVQTFAREDHEHAQFLRQSWDLVKARVGLTLRQTSFHLVVDLITVAGTAAVIWLGGYHVLQGRLTLGALLVSLSYLGAVYAPLSTIGNTFPIIQDALISARRVFEVLDTVPQVRDRPGAPLLPSVDGHVRFEAVSFSYDDSQPVLQDVSFEVLPGQTVGVVGLSGAGKTTLVSLITRLYDPSAGRVLIDSHDLRDVQVRSVREQVGLVLQETVLFAGTVAENIAYGRPEASLEEIVEAARQANAHDFIMRLPDGYQSDIGEDGAKLSGGQRQRLAIARAFLKNAPILVLDEPASAMDAEAEAAVMEATARLMCGRTTFIAAHRLSTLRQADQVLVIENGRIVERGTPAELVASGGLYARLYTLQTEMPRDEEAQASDVQPEEAKL
jgi:ATP-binding cassette subfamily B protein